MVSANGWSLMSKGSAHGVLAPVYAVGTTGVVVLVRSPPTQNSMHESVFLFRIGMGGLASVALFSHRLTLSLSLASCVVYVCVCVRAYCVPVFKFYTRSPRHLPTVLHAPCHIMSVSLST